MSNHLNGMLFLRAKKNKKNKINLCNFLSYGYEFMIILNIHLMRITRM